MTEIFIADESRFNNARSAQRGGVAQTWSGPWCPKEDWDSLAAVRPRNHLRRQPIGDDSENARVSPPASALALMRKLMSGAPDLREFLHDWPYDPGNNVRVAHGADGREIIMVRQPMGLELYEADGRPDGQRPHGMESALEFQLTRLTAARRADTESAFKLSTADCAELFDEGTLYHHRVAHFFHLPDWMRVERDTARILSLMAFIKQHAGHQEDRVQADLWGTFSARNSLQGINGHAADADHLRELIHTLLQPLNESPAIHPALPPHEDPAFIRRGDYWSIRYQGQAANLKATRGLDCLCYLLRHPGREIHVSELLATLGEVPAPAFPGGVQEADGLAVTTGLHDAGPILDPQSKAEYKCRIDDLREDMEEAERFNDFHRAATARSELDAIVHQLAAAVGLGGRDRRASSDAERARSAATKRIKETIHRIAAAIPPLGHHLSARIKTGYFCSYNSHPDRPVAWKF